jgi:hypothetical protein
MFAITLQSKSVLLRALLSTAAVLAAVTSNLFVSLDINAGLIAEWRGEAIPAHPSHMAFVIATAAISVVAVLIALFATLLPARPIDRIGLFILSLIVPGIMVFMAVYCVGVMMAGP